MLTYCKLYYRYFEGNMEHVQLLGFVKFSVADVINTWEKKVKKHYMRPDRSEKEDKLIERWAKKDWYTEYVIKKYEKMELITKEGIFRPRVLDYADVILCIVEKLKTLTKINALVNKSIIRNYVKAEFRKRKIPTSIIGEELATREVEGILDVYEAYFKLCRKIDKIRMGEDKLGQLQDLLKVKDELANSIKLQEEEIGS